MKKTLLATTLVVASAFASNAIANVISPQTASVKVISALTVDQDTALNFATIIKPAAGQSVTVTVPPDGGAPTGSATVVGTTTAGAYTIKGDGTQTISISVAASGTVAGLTLDTFKMRYNGVDYTSGSAAAPGAAGKTLNVGSTLTVDSTVATGSVLTPGFDITVNYQ